jgi:hypothetical protein
MTKGTGYKDSIGMEIHIGDTLICDIDQPNDGELKEMTIQTIEDAWFIDQDINAGLGIDWYIKEIQLKS